MQLHIGFDIGGTNTRVAQVTAEGIGEMRKIPTPRNPEEGIRTLAQLIRECAGSAGVAAVVGGFPGVVAEGTAYRAPNLEAWSGVKLAARLSEGLGVSVVIHNDADLAALGEAVFGAGKGKRIVAYIGVGTGIGSGRVVLGRIDGGVYDFEAGHQIIEAKTSGSLEDLVSGAAFEKRFRIQAKDAPRAMFEENVPLLAAGIYNTILHWSPDVIVLGGSMMNEDTGYRRGDVLSALERLPKVYPSFPEIKTALLKDEAGLHGARAILFEKIGTQ